MDADGTDVEQLTHDAAVDSAPAWSPDGTRLAFESTRDGEDHELCTPDLDSGTVTRLTDNDVPATCRSPSGVASVVAVELRCRRAVGLARRWQLRAQQAGASPWRVLGFRCRTRHHSFDQVLVTCEDRHRDRAAAFVWRTPAAA